MDALNQETTVEDKTDYSLLVDTEILLGEIIMPMIQILIKLEFVLEAFLL